MLLSAAGLRAAGTTLGVDFTEPLPFSSVAQIATDGTGALYILDSNSAQPAGGTVTKLSADGNTILWQSQKTIAADGTPIGAIAMAVDPGGDVFVLLGSEWSAPTSTVGKLTADGAGFAWTATVAIETHQMTAMAADAKGRLYVVGACASGYCPTSSGNGALIRLTADGTATDYSVWLPGPPSSLAVDNTGVAYVVGGDIPGETATLGYVFWDYIEQFQADGSGGYFAILPETSAQPQIQLDTSGNPVVSAGTDLLRLFLYGLVESRVTLTDPKDVPFLPTALDAEGNAYVGASSSQLYHTTNSIAGCGDAQSESFGEFALLNVVAPNGSIMQSTYLPGAWAMPPYGPPMVATGPNSKVYVVAGYSGAATTQAGPFQGPYHAILFRLSPNSSAQTVPLACVGNAATANVQAVAPGELVTLIGNGLGPQTGVQTSATLSTAYPPLESGVEVTFDGTPAPLLWVQDSQINAVVPWSVAGPTTQICSSYNGKQTNCLNWPVTQVAPGVFTTDGFHAAAVNQDGSVNSASNPAPRNSAVSIFATGLGPISPAQADGTLVGLPLPANTLPISVVAGESCIEPIIGIPCPQYTYTPPYAGPEPYTIAGVTQINLSAANAIASPGGAQPNYVTVTVESGNQWVRSNEVVFYLANQ